MGYEFTNDAEKVPKPAVNTTFDAEAVLLVRSESGTWSEKRVKITSVGQLKLLVGEGYSVEQVNVDKYHKIYYSLVNLEKYGSITAHYKSDEELHMMSAPILLVQCDDSKPVDIMPDSLKKMKEMLDLF